MLHMKEDETIDTFIGKLTTLVNKAASLGHTIEDFIVIRKLLNAVPDKFLQIVTSIEQYSDLDEMSVDEAIGRLKTFEERLKSKKEIPMNSQESLMFTRHEGQGKPFREHGRGRFNQSRGREQDKNNYQSKREEHAECRNHRECTNRRECRNRSERVQKPQEVQKTARSAEKILKFDQCYSECQRKQERRLNGVM
nr:zinc finger, CCHC-type [Tanacetum cinerariifolium]